MRKPLKFTTLLLALLLAVQGSVWGHGKEGAELSDALVDLHRLPIGKALTETQVIAQLQSGEPELRQEALLHLLRLKLTPERVIALLTPQLEYDLLRQAEAPEADEATQTFLKNVVVVVARYGTGARTVVPHLIRLLIRSKPGSVKETTVRALGVVGRDDPNAIAALSEIIEGDDENTALVAIQTLGRLKAAAKDATPTLTKALSRTWKRVPTAPYAAFVALGQIESPAQPLPVQEAIAQLQRDDLSPGQLSRVFLALQEYESIASAATPRLLKIATSNKQAYIVGAALYTLGHVGLNAGEEPARLLLNALAADDPALAPIAQRALQHLKPGDKASVGSLAQAIEHQSVAVRHAAALALAKLGPDAKPATEALARTLRKTQKTDTEELDAYWQRVHDYLMALLSIGPGASAATDTIVVALGTDSPLWRGLNDIQAAGLRIDLLMVLNSIGMPSDKTQRATVLEAVRSALTTSDYRLFSTAARAAGNLGADAAPLVLLLLRGLATDGTAPGKLLNGVHIVPPSTRFEAIRALGKIGTAAAAAIPHLTRIINDKDQLSTLLNGEARLALRSIQG